MLNADLLQRLNARATDPAQRHNAAEFEMMAGQTTILNTKSLFGVVSMAVGGKPQNEPPQYAPAPLPAPASRQDIATAEQHLGVKLPNDLKSLYLCVADGGFGPSDGVLSLEKAVKYFKDLTSEPQGEYSEEWPVHLYPIVQWDMGCDAYDLNSRKIIRWTPEILVEEPGQNAWKKSFSTVAESLAAYLEDWLASARPATPQSEAATSHEIAAPMGNSVDMAKFTHLRNCYASLQRAEPGTREKWGLPEGPLEDALCEFLNLDPDIYVPVLKAISQDRILEPRLTPRRSSP